MFKNVLELHENCGIVYNFGSRVYGTFDEDSDYDKIAILRFGLHKTTTFQDFYNEHFIYWEYLEFIEKIKNHDIVALECLSYIKSEFNEHFDYNEHKLRESISTISNNSWTKGKKKLIISGDYDKKAGLKSIFHSIRILRFGIQIARNREISDYSEVNWFWDELKKLGEQYDADILWKKIDEKYRSLFNSTSSEFKALAKKDLTVRDLSKQLKDLLETNNCYTFELHKQIWDIFQ